MHQVMHTTKFFNRNHTFLLYFKRPGRGGGISNSSYIRICTGCTFLARGFDSIKKNDFCEKKIVARRDFEQKRPILAVFCMFSYYRARSCDICTILTSSHVV